MVATAMNNLVGDPTEYGSILEALCFHLPRRGGMLLEGRKKGLQMLFHPQRKQSTLNNKQLVSLALRAMKEVIGKANDQATEQFGNWLNIAGHVNITFSEHSKCSQNNDNFNKGINQEQGIKRQGACLEQGQINKLAKIGDPVFTPEDLAKFD